MRLAKLAIVTVVLVGILVLALTATGWWFFGRNIWGGVAQAQGPAGSWLTCAGPTGMMGGYYAGAQAPATGQRLTIQQAQAAVEQYIAGNPNLVVDEIMEFDRNFYALIQEKNTGIGAMELLVNTQTGLVGPEYGPNMMWNAKYGMMAGGMMGGWSTSDPQGDMAVTPADALQIAQRWLDANRPGVTTEGADPFYGYYTVHTLKDGKIDGMLSVHGGTGQVWYHTWHGEFIDVLGGEQ